MKIPIAKPFFDACEEELLLETLRSGWVVQGRRVAGFEELFSRTTGAGHAVAVSNCTTALHLCLAALGIGPGDEVIVPSFTYVATANAVEHTGARAVFCDIDPATFNMDVASLRRRITGRTRAVIPVHLFGLAADMDAIVPLCRERGLRIVEDAACGLGATYHGRHVGTFGDAGCFSFHPRKIVTTGEGGMITLEDADLDALLRSMRDHGASASDFLRHTGSKSALLPEFNVLGYNYRLTDLQAAIGLAQMAKLDSILALRRARAERYRRALQGLPGIRLPAVPDGLTHSYQSFVITCTWGFEGFPDGVSWQELKAKRDRVIEELEESGVSTRQGTHAVHALGYYRKKVALPDESLPNSRLCESATIALPLYPQMSDEEQDQVVDSLLRVLGR